MRWIMPGNVLTSPENEGCGSASQLFCNEKGRQICAGGALLLRQSRSPEPVQCVHRTADRNINPNPRFGKTESSTSDPTKGEQKIITGTPAFGKYLLHSNFQPSQNETLAKAV
jgi:hypothetical protein